MADLTLPDGTEINIDLDKITIREYRKFASGSMLSDEDDVVIARCIGMEVEAVRNLPQPQYRRLLQAFFKKASEPLADPT